MRFCELRGGDSFLDTKAKACTIEEKIDKWGFFQSKRLGCSEHTQESEETTDMEYLQVTGGEGTVSRIEQ